jgi:ParB family transcriptional regulator, chromosome partitioning protein
MIIAAYRRDGLSLAQVMAFAVSDDHAAQERVFDNLSDWNREPDSIRDALTEHEIAATDRRVRFVTLAAYEVVGGAVRRGLFCEDASRIFILDTALLDRLVAEKLEAEAAAVRAEGWKWVETRPSFDYADWSEFKRRHEESVPLSAEAEAELQRRPRNMTACATKMPSPMKKRRRVLPRSSSASTNSTARPSGRPRPSPSPEPLSISTMTATLIRRSRLFPKFH